jgi:hypothetical protein
VQLEQARKGSAAQADNASVGVPADLQKKLDDVNRLVAQRQAEIARTGAPGSGSASEGSAGATGSGALAPSNPLVALETDWQRLLRATSDAKAAHDDLQRRMERASLRASAAEATGDAQMEIIDPAYRPTRPARGGRTNVALVGFALALLVSVAYAFTRVLTDDRLLDADDIEALGLVPVLGVVPRIDTRVVEAANDVGQAHEEATP